MTISTVSNQGFTDKNHICGMNFLSHSKGAPQPIRIAWDESRKSFRSWDEGEGRHHRLIG
jgi:hypothetical protein